MNIKPTDFLKPPSIFNQLVKDNKNNIELDYKDFNDKMKKILNLQKGIDKSNKIIEQLQTKRNIIDNDIKVYSENVINLEKLQQEWLSEI
jgi:hypothetical protein